jgi:hypothetical protein
MKSCDIKTQLLSTKIAIIVALLLGTPTAYAQSSYSPSGSYHTLGPTSTPVAHEEEQGISLGNFRLHPGFSLAGGYNSNVFYEEENEGIESTAVLRLLPSIRLESVETQKVQLGVNLQLLLDYLPNDNESIRNQSGVDILGDLGLMFGHRGVASVELYDLIRLFSDSPTAPTSQTRDHLYNEAGITVSLHPGGSERTSRLGFTGSLTAALGTDIWDADLNLNRDIFMTYLELKYFFLPKTALSVEVNYQNINYDDYDRSIEIDNDDLGLEEAFSGSLVNVDSAPLRSTLGIKGLLTRQIDFSIDGGYAISSYDEGEDFSGWIADVRAGLFFTPEAHLSVGWERGFYDSSFSNYYVFNRYSGHLNVAAGDWLVGGNGGFESRQYSHVESPVLEIAGSTIPLYSSEDRTDPLIVADTYLSWQFVDWGRISASYQFTGNLTDFVVTTGRASGPNRPNSSASQYIKHGFFLATEFEY